MVERIVREVRADLDAEKADKTALLARLCLDSMALHEITSLDLPAFKGACLELLDLGAKRSPKKPEVRLLDPSTVAGAWQSSHSVIAVVTDDMPFLVDSITGALAQRELEIHVALHPQVAVRRDDDGCLLEIAEIGSADDGFQNESFTLFEFDAQSGSETLVEIETDIFQVLADVRKAVEDWRAMRDTNRRLLKELAEKPLLISDEEAAETRDFLRWIDDDHFTFLGCLEYRLEDEDDRQFLRPVEESGLGLWRKLPLEAKARAQTPLSDDTARLLVAEPLVSITKSTHRSTVHRQVHMDILTFKKYEGARLAGQIRFLGLFTSTAYSIRASQIPLVRHKVERVIERAGFLPASHNSKGFRHIVESYPRNELFQISTDDLFHFALRILDLQLRPRLALLVREDEAEQFISCMIFIPRDRHSTHLRKRIAKYLEGIFRGELAATYTSISDSPLARVLFLIMVQPGKVPGYDVRKIERRLADVSRTWSERLKEVLTEGLGEEPGLLAWRRYQDAFPSSYAELSSAEAALDDIPKIGRVLDRSTFAMRLYRIEGSAISRFHLRTFELAVPAPLSDLLPKIENMGLEINTEVPFEVRPGDAANPVWIRDFELVTKRGTIDLEAVREPFEEAFRRLWRGEMENDAFNRLVIAAGLGWREVVLLRAYARYLRQIGSAFSQRYTADILAKNAEITRLLIDLFEALHDPDRAAGDENGDENGGEADAEGLRQKIHDAFENIRSADADRILRRFLGLIEATLRTNFYQTVEVEHRDGKTLEPKEYLALKFDGQKIEDLPKPRPRFEIFVYSPDVEAVHLRGGRVARGGIRWSDRREDFRTEVLGLVKAQMVKNAVIVPVGAKGGFIVKRPPKGSDREEIYAHGLHCYKMMIRGLLDVTDNLDADGRVLPPTRVKRRDGDDVYLVVAADKGTATFSDAANQVAAEYDFWLGDAFASGGSVGYDHKKMGITARGAWESVKRHFREMTRETKRETGRATGRDIQSEPFTVAGVGDMSGDVFGNGLLLSEQTKLVAAFNHLHIFIDPDPDPARSFAERRRLFHLERSAWTDYNLEIVSPGGGVFERHARQIDLSPEARELLGLPGDPITPVEVIRAILRAPVDLLWFGGIGTYAKASGETHSQAGDRANDEVRVDARELRAKVIGEGANLGITQRGRIEYARRGGRINTDFIDNSGGVDCSDHEVNIKIALDGAVRAGKLSAEKRASLLGEMTDEVARLVLLDNELQSLSITLTEHQGGAILDEQAQILAELERAGHVERQLESLPDEAEIAERRDAGQGLTRPEIAVLLAASKIYVYNELLDSPLPDEAPLVEDLVRYFPRPMREPYREEIEGHRLRREIIATHVTNSIINRVGPTFVPRMAKETGRTVSEIARAYTAARDLFDLRSLWQDIDSLDNQISADLQVDMHVRTNRLLERVSRWLLRYGGRPLDISGLVERHEADIVMVSAQLEDMLAGRARDRLRRKMKRLRDQGLPQDLASRVAALEIMPSACDVARCAAESGIGVERIGRIYFAVGEGFGFDRLLKAAREILNGDPWQQAAVMALAEELYFLQAELTRKVAASSAERPKAAIGDWRKANPIAVGRLEQLLKDFDAVDRIDLAMLTVAERELRRLAET